MKEICRNCHFLAREYREENTGIVHSYSLSKDERNDFKSGVFDKIGDRYSLKCHMGVWDEGVDPNKKNRPRLINEIDRKNECFFYPHKPAMLFPAAKILQNVRMNTTK